MKQPEKESSNTSKIGEPATAYPLKPVPENYLNFPDWPNVPLPEYSNEEAFLLSLRHAHEMLAINGIQPWLDRQESMNPERFEL